MKTPEIISDDPYLKPYEDKISLRISRFKKALNKIYKKDSSMGSAFEYYGTSKKDDKIVIREWAPNAVDIYLLCSYTSWQPDPSVKFTRLNDHGDWEIAVDSEVLNHRDYYRILVEWPGGRGERIPVYAERVWQDPESYIFSGQIWLPEKEYTWKHDGRISSAQPPLVYEAHVGMAQEEGRIGSFNEFRTNVLPKIISAGFNTIQLMALMEHPYYGSFGYQVSSFFALSSLYGTPEEFKQLVDECHQNNIKVIMDLVHSHAVKNEVEGISKQDGSDYLYFHGGPKGYHPAWDSRCFNYGKDEVINFLLSNCSYWLKEYRVDGFRFDGVTSMLYFDHGLGISFDNYDKYFNENVDEDAVLYLTLANDLIHKIKPEAITVAEDMSGMPGIGRDPVEGGLGFDYRLAMGIPDYWIKLIKTLPDEEWDVVDIWNTLNNRRFTEKHIAYSESHDQALVGDKTILFRLLDSAMYTDMDRNTESIAASRGTAVFRIINLLTMTAGGDGFLNFMGNEFGHPEWIDFPREGNNWSYHYARRQWSLADNKQLRYSELLNFYTDLINKCSECMSSLYADLIVHHRHDQVLCYERGGFYFFINLNPEISFCDYGIKIPAGRYSLLLSTDSSAYGGFGRVPDDLSLDTIKCSDGINRLTPYLPSRSALVFKKD